MAEKKIRATPKRRAKGTGDDLWEKNPHLVRTFIERRPDYEHLCDEVAYILRKRLAEQQIEVSAVTRRAKSLKSFLEKVRRKAYSDPLVEATDLAGARVVCLYATDLPTIGAIIEAEFEVVERLDKLDDKEPDRFGYGATHYLVKIGRGSSGARYEDVKDMVCEIQVRTVLQDAWAIIQHHLVYKQEAHVPRTLQRKLNSLAGLFETADDQFDRIRTERMKYVADLRESSSAPERFLDNELNLDTLRVFLAWKFLNRGMEAWDGQVRMLFDWINRDRYPTLRDVNELLERTTAARAAVSDAVADTVVKATDGSIPANVEVFWALALTDGEFEGREHGDPDWLPALEEQAKLLADEEWAT